MKVNFGINIDKRENTYYNESNIEIFTYKDYMAYMNYLLENAKYKENKSENMLREESSKYFAISDTYKEINKKVNNEHDKIFRKILDIKSEAANFINNVLNPKKEIKPEQIEKYNSSFVTKNLVNQECDVIYKLKDKNIFFLIEQQTKIDYTMPLRILEYEVAIMRSVKNYGEYGNKDYKAAKIYPIVLYTGKGKWNAKTYVNEIQEQLEGAKEREFGRYNLVDINNIQDEQLLREKTYLSKIMLLEKYKGKKSTEYLNRIINEIDENRKEYDNEGKEVLIIMLEQILEKKIGEEQVNEIIKKLKGDDVRMLNFLESIDRENKAIFNNGKKAGIKEGIKTGIKTGIEKTIQKMLDLKIPISQIVKITDYSEEKIKQIQKDN